MKNICKINVSDVFKHKKRGYLVQIRNKIRFPTWQTRLQVEIVDLYSKHTVATWWSASNFLDNFEKVIV